MTLKCILYSTKILYNYSTGLLLENTQVPSKKGQEIVFLYNTADINSILGIQFLNVRIDNYLPNFRTNFKKS